MQFTTSDLCLGKSLTDPSKDQIYLRIICEICILGLFSTTQRTKKSRLTEKCFWAGIHMFYKKRKFLFLKQLFATSWDII